MCRANLRVLFAFGLLLPLAASAAEKRALKNLPHRERAPLTRNSPIKKEYPSFGSIERLTPEFDVLVPPDAQIEKLAEGFEWSEGPVWDRRRRCLYFSDVPRNVVFKWVEGVGTREFLLPSGYTGSRPRKGGLGSNGLALDRAGRLLLCQHGDRAVARLEKDGRFTILAEYYQWRRFNSPNDLTLDARGNLYFTDPPYGLEGGENDPARELMFSGVYRLDRQGTVTLLTKELSRPNGIDLSPDGQTLYVANSDPQRALWMAYELKADGTLASGRVFFDATPMTQGQEGLPDGLKVDAHGNLFATGPGGVLVFSPDGKHLGTIRTGTAIANCAWGDDGSTLYLTSHMYLARVKTRTKGKGF